MITLGCMDLEVFAVSFEVNSISTHKLVLVLSGEISRRNPWIPFSKNRLWFFLQTVMLWLFLQTLLHIERLLVRALCNRIFFLLGQ